MGPKSPRRYPRRRDGSRPHIRSGAAVCRLSVRGSLEPGRCPRKTVATRSPGPAQNTPVDMRIRRATPNPIPARFRQGKTVRHSSLHTFRSPRHHRRDSRTCTGNQTFERYHSNAVGIVTRSICRGRYSLCKCHQRTGGLRQLAHSPLGTRRSHTDREAHNKQRCTPVLCS